MRDAKPSSLIPLYCFLLFSSLAAIYMYITTRSIYMKKDLTAEEARRTISPTSDLFARWLFSAPNHENLTKSFINAVLEDAGHEQKSTAGRQAAPLLARRA